MKFLVSDYSSSESTEPLYLNTIFNSIGCNSTVWSQNISAFDVFDLTKPDVFITHFSKISKDVVMYLKDNKNIDTVINITGLNQENLKRMEETLHEFSIKPNFFFVNQYDHNLKSNKTNIHVILHCADILFGQQNRSYSIQNGIMVDHKDHIKPVGETYHYLSNNQKLEQDADIVMPAHKLIPFYHNYGSIIFRYFNNSMPQTFFDAGYYNGSVYFDINDRSALNPYLQKLFGEDNLCTKENQQIHKRIKQKHTCLHRAKSILSQLPCKEYTDKLQAIIEEQLK